jgi:hypothetical protein
VSVEKEQTEQEAQEKVEKKGEESKETGAEKREVRHKYKDLELDEAQLNQALEHAEQAGAYINYLKREGVIDDTGKIIKKEAKEAKETKEDAEDEDSRLKKLEERQTKLESEKETDKVLGKFNTQLRAHSRGIEDEDIKNVVETLVTAQFYMDPTSNISLLHSKAHDTIKKIIKKEQEKWLKSKAPDEKTEGAGGAGILTSDKKYGRKDVRSGAVRKALLQKLEKLEVG